MSWETFKTEVTAGLSTFFTLSYLLLLYPLLLHEGGMDFGAALTATILIIILATSFIALYANFPAVLAPGIGVGAFIIFSVVIQQNIPWKIALGIVFWTGFMVFLLSVFKIRQKILFSLPHSIKYGAVSGIGAFLFMIALINLSLIKTDPFTFFQFDLFLPKQLLIAFFALLIFTFLYRKNIHSSFLISILFCWIFSLTFGLTHWKGFIALPPSLSPTWLQADLLSPLHFKYVGVLISFLLVTLFDSSASLTALARVGDFFDEKGQIRNIDRIVIPDGVMSMFGALLGTTNLSFTLESSSGIKAGGRTGWAAFIAAFCTSLALFLYPLFSSIPLFATAPALMAISYFMVKNVKEIRWSDWTEAVPFCVILILIPLTFSIYKGIAFGFVSYGFTKILSGRWKEMHKISWILCIIFALHLSWTYLR